jgi:hypothetical protein
MGADQDMQARLGVVAAFLGQGPLRTTVGDLEVALDGRKTQELADVNAAHGVTVELLRSAVAAREAFGKINDVIHSVGIALALPHLLEPGETLRRPSLAAGNTPERLYDVETDRRIAEFKFARWDGHDGGRQKTTVKDLARLAADKTGRRAELYVLGERPINWLATTRSPVHAKLKGYPAEVVAFEAVFGDPAIPISEFVAGAAAHVRLINIERRLPQLFGPAGVRTA